MASVAENKYKKRVSILDAAYELFTSKSFSDTAIDDVVKLAGVAKGTFYLYFRDKYDLLDQIVLHRASDIVIEAYKKLRQKNDTAPMNVSQQFIYITDQITDYLRKNKKVTALLDGRLSVCFSNKGVAVNSALCEVSSYFISLLTQLKYSAEDAKKRLFVLTNMISSVCFDAVLSEKPFTLDEITPTLHDFLKILLPEVITVDK